MSSSVPLAVTDAAPPHVCLSLHGTRSSSVHTTALGHEHRLVTLNASAVPATIAAAANNANVTAAKDDRRDDGKTCGHAIGFCFLVFLGRRYAIGG